MVSPLVFVTVMFSYMFIRITCVGILRVNVVCVSRRGVGAASSLASKIGPFGLSPKKTGEDGTKETARDWRGQRLTVKLTVQNRQVCCRPLLLE